MALSEVFLACGHRRMLDMGRPTWKFHIRHSWKIYCRKCKKRESLLRHAPAKKPEKKEDERKQVSGCPNGCLDAYQIQLYAEFRRRKIKWAAICLRCLHLRPEQQVPMGLKFLKDRTFG